jgi:hypothetical protein
LTEHTGPFTFDTGCAPLDGLARFHRGVTDDVAQHGYLEPIFSGRRLKGDVPG